MERCSPAEEGSAPMIVLEECWCWQLREAPDVRWCRRLLVATATTIEPGVSAASGHPATWPQRWRSGTCRHRVPARSRPDFFLRRQGVATLGEVTRWRPCSADGNGGRFGWRRLDSDGPGLWRRLARTRARRTYEGRGGGPGVGHGTRRRRKRGGATAGRVSCGAGSRPGSVSSVEQGSGGGGPVGEEAGEWSADMRAPQYSNGRRRFDLIQISNLNELKFDSNCSNLTDPKGTFPSLIFKNKMWL
jgi:hypothetical protein